MHLRPCVRGFSAYFVFVSLGFFSFSLTQWKEKRNNGVWGNMEWTYDQNLSYPRLGTGTVAQLLRSFTTLPEVPGSIPGIPMATQNQL